MNEKLEYHALPKVELHLHLDCSMSYAVAKKIKPSLTEADFQRDFIAPDKCRNLADYLKRANQQLALMQTAEQLRLVTLDLFEQLAAENVIYAEIRFAPLLHLEQGLPPREVVRIVNEAVTEGKQKTGIEAGLILATLRHYSEAQSMETVRLVQEFQGTNVVGFDIAADEAAWPIDAHKSAFSFAYEQGLNATAHAGEAKGAESIRETLEYFRPSRIGHGVRSVEDPNLVALLAEKKIHLEICPTSNIQTNVFQEMEDHVVDQLYRSGISLSINTDGRTISNTRLSEEYRLLAEHFGWTIDHFRYCNLEAIRHAFTDEATKRRLESKILAAYG